MRRESAASAAASLKREMRAFWGPGWSKRADADVDRSSRARLLQDLGAIRLLLELEESEQVREMRALGLRGKSVLEIGCGAGSSSLLFALEGARVTSVDLTDSAVALTRSKFDLLELPGRFVQADAEHLPFGNGRFDVVFSSGVLHHTPDTERAVGEIYRVLTPGGHAVVMLYARWSFLYLVELLLIRGLLFGGVFRYGARRWLGSVTERAWRTNAKVLNPVTKVYSARQMKALCRRFQVTSLRKHSFHWPDLFPGIYHVWKRRRVRIGNAESIPPSALEVAVGRWAGFALVISLRRP